MHARADLCYFYGGLREGKRRVSGASRRVPFLKRSHIRRCGSPEGRPRRAAPKGGPEGRPRRAAPKGGPEGRPRRAGSWTSRELGALVRGVVCLQKVSQWDLSPFQLRDGLQGESRAQMLGFLLSAKRNSTNRRSESVHPLDDHRRTAFHRCLTFKGSS
jgi:hypothetical protein